MAVVKPVSKVHATEQLRNPLSIHADLLARSAPVSTVEARLDRAATRCAVSLMRLSLALDVRDASQVYTGSQLVERYRVLEREYAPWFRRVAPRAGLGEVTGLRGDAVGGQP